MMSGIDKSSRLDDCACAVFALPLLLVVLLCAPLTQAIDSETLGDPVLQVRYVAISKELRCLVCQNQSIYDSNAELAQDLRRQVREMLESGRADDEIYKYMIERYGDYVRYRPPWRINTLLLQLFPVFIALFGFSMLWGTLRKSRRAKRAEAGAPELSGNELANGGSAQNSSGDDETNTSTERR